MNTITDGITLLNPVGTVQISDRGPFVNRKRTRTLTVGIVVLFLGTYNSVPHFAASAWKKQTYTLNLSVSLQHLSMHTRFTPRCLQHLSMHTRYTPRCLQDLRVHIRCTPTCLQHLSVHTRYTHRCLQHLSVHTRYTPTSTFIFFSIFDCDEITTNNNGLFSRIAELIDCAIPVNSMIISQFVEHVGIAHQAVRTNIILYFIKSVRTSGGRSSTFTRGRRLVGIGLLQECRSGLNNHNGVVPLAWGIPIIIYFRISTLIKYNKMV